MSKKESRNQLQLGKDYHIFFFRQGNRIKSNDPVVNVAKESDAESASTSTVVNAAPVLRLIFYP